MACLGARGDKGSPAGIPAFGDIGIELEMVFSARGMGELGGRSPGRGLIGRPGDINDGAMLFRNI